MKQFLSVHDVPDLQRMLTLAAIYKNFPLKDGTLGAGRRIGLLFLNPSLRTRISTQVAAQNLGMEAIVFNVGSEGWALEFGEGAVMNGSTVEHIKDAAPVLGQYFDILAIRTFPGLQDRQADYSEQTILQFVRYAGIPVVSLESATLHPLQSLADLLTITTNLPTGRRPKVALTWAPHVKALPQCVANSFAQWMTAWGGADFHIAHPEGYALDPQYTDGAHITHRQEEAFEGADFIYVKNWSALEPYGAVLSDDRSWMPGPHHLERAPEARILHCLPVRREVELSGALLDSSASLVTEQAGNRVPAAQAVLSTLLKNL